MNIIKYGKGYEPKVVTCEHCKSEIEYFDKDLETQNQTIYYEEDVAAEIEHIGFTCPVCNTWIDAFQNIFIRKFL